MAISRGSANAAARSQPDAAWIAAPATPTPDEAQNALDAAVSSRLAACTSASANRAFTPTQSSTCIATAAAPMPTSAGPIRRATMKAEAKDRPAETPASSPDQKTLPRIREPRASRLGHRDRARAPSQSRTSAGPATTGRQIASQISRAW